MHCNAWAFKVSAEQAGAESLNMQQGYLTTVKSLGRNLRLTNVEKQALVCCLSYKLLFSSVGKRWIFVVVIECLPNQFGPGSS